jgi:Asp-tRNA(Asn)/Glu-tRNA(Gln) amidotransferase A subunit family amidase
VLAGNLYNDDLILSVANRYQSATDWHTRHPKL